MQSEKAPNPTPLFGVIFIAVIFIITFLLVGPLRNVLFSEAGPSAEGLSILYLADASQIPVESYRQPDVLRRDLSSTIQVIDDGTAAAAALEPELLEALDVLIIDQSALTFINPEDITDAYDASVVVFGLNIPVTELSRLVDDTRLTRDNFAADPYPGDFFIYTAQSVTGDNPDEVARVDEAARSGNDDPFPPVMGRVSSSYSAGQNNLITPRDFEIFNAVLSLRGLERHQARVL
jgi:hypothetical protein